MSENKPNWADKAALASSVLTNAQLQQVQSTLRTLGALQADQVRQQFGERQTREREDRLREGMWQMENAFNNLVRDMAVTPCALHVMAKQAQTVMAQFGLATGSFRELVDKDRVGQFSHRIQNALHDSLDKMSAEERTAVEKYLRYCVEVQELKKGIVLEEARLAAQQAAEKEDAARRTVSGLQQKREAIRIGYGKTFGERLVYLGLPFAGAFALAFTVIEMLDEKGIKGMSAWDLIGNVVITLPIGAFFAVILKLIREGLSPQTKIANDLQAEIERLEKEITHSDEGEDEDDASEPELSFSEHQRTEMLTEREAMDLSDMLKQKQEREAFMIQFRQANGLPLEDFWQQAGEAGGLNSHRELSPEVQELARRADKKVSAIQLYQKQTGASLAESKKAVEAFSRASRSDDPQAN